MSVQIASVKFKPTIQNMGKPCFATRTFQSLEQGNRVLAYYAQAFNHPHLYHRIDTRKNFAPAWYDGCDPEMFEGLGQT